MSKLLHIIFTVMPNRNRSNRMFHSELSFCSFHISWSHLKSVGELMNVFPEVKFFLHICFLTLCGEGAVSFFKKKKNSVVSQTDLFVKYNQRKLPEVAALLNPHENAYSPYLRLLHYRLMAYGLWTGPLGSTCCIVLTYMTFKDI